jgi:hypothetical protein
MIYGVIPIQIIELIKQNQNDRLIKLRCIEDFDNIISRLGRNPEFEPELVILRNYASSFIQFVEEYLLNDFH